MKNKLTKTIAATLLLATVIAPATAMATEVQEGQNTSAATQSAMGGNSISPMAEETTWVYREHNGWIQKRQWSVTYAKWLTDWINVRKL